MLVDPQELLDMAAAMAQRSSDVGSLDQQLAGRVAASHWAGQASDRFRRQHAVINGRMTHHADGLQLLAARLRQLADLLSRELDALRAIELEVQQWFAAHPAAIAPVPPWPRASLPPSGDPTWRDVERAFRSAGIPLQAAPSGAMLVGPTSPAMTETVLGLPVTPAEKWIINHEDGTYATNAYNPVNTPTGHAFGLGQLTEVIRKKYLGADYATTDPAKQLAAMRAYIRDRYQTPERAVEFWKVHHWY